MKKISNFIVKHRIPVLVIFGIAALCCAAMIPRVNIINDMSEYLPDDSPMKQGIALMEQEFPDMESDNTIRVMFQGLPEDSREAVKSKLENTAYVDSVDYDADSGEYNRDGYVLYILNTPYAPDSDEVAELESTLEKDYSDGYNMVCSVDTDEVAGVPVWILGLAIVILMAILLVMCSSWAEPFLIMTSILIAVLMNMGTNAFLGGVSYITNSIAAILQLVLSIDYSIMLINRYRQETGMEEDHAEAMKKALTASFASITSSSVTTIVGLLALVFMKFKIGADMGLVLAKGVLISLVCIFTVLPSLLLLFDKAVKKTEKKTWKFNMTKLGGFSYRFRYGITVVFLVFFVGMLFGKGNTQVAYTMTEESEIDQIFPKKNRIVLLYNNQDEKQAAQLADALQNEEGVSAVICYGNSLGKEYTAQEMQAMLADMGSDMQISPDMINMIYDAYRSQTGNDRITIAQLLAFLQENIANNPQYEAYFDADSKAQLAEAGELLASEKEQLVGEKHSLMLISTTLPVEGTQTNAFLEKLEKDCAADFTKDYYLIGNSPMQYEMALTFQGEMNTITLLTAAAIFCVVAVTFHSMIIPLILVLIIQAGVNTTIAIIGVQGYSIYFLALLIVQCILMGATIDYGILFTSYYRESRKTLEIKDALIVTYQKSMPTIMTSGMIIVLVVGIVGYAFSNPAVGQICQTISKGALCAILLIVFLLPGILAVADKWICKKKCKR